MKPTQPAERSSGAISRQAGDVVMVGTQIALPRLSAITFRTSWASWPSGGLQADQDGRGAFALAAQAVVLGDAVDVVGPLQAGVRDREGVEERLREAHHRVPRLLRVLVLLTAQETDHVEERDLAVHGHAAQRVDRRV